MSVFDQRYAQAYDLLYQDKDYATEANYVVELAKQFVRQPQMWLDIGCGTGRHVRFIAEPVSHMVGIDVSAEMIALAEAGRPDNVTLKCAHSGTFRSEQPFDVITALFYVFNCHCQAKDVHGLLTTVSQCLAKKGVFIFDFWYGSAVLRDPPTVRSKKAQDEKWDILRYSESVMNYQHNQVEVNFTTHLYNLQTASLVIETENNWYGVMEVTKR